MPQHPSLIEQRAKQTRKTVEGTVHSYGHNSWETETKATVFVVRLHVNNKTKMNHSWSHCTCTLTLLSLKQNKNASLKKNSRGHLLSTVLKMFLFKRVKGVQSFCTLDRFVPKLIYYIVVHIYHWINVLLFQVAVAFTGEWRSLVILLPSAACSRVFAEICLSP